MQHSTFRKWFLILISLAMLFGIVGTPWSDPPASVQAGGPADPWSQGSFTQPWTVDKYTTQAQWDSEFTYMQNVDMTLWIYQWTGNSKANTTIYPTNIPGYSQSSAYDQVETALATADRFGFKVFMGLVFNSQWWHKEGTDLNWLLGEAAEMNAVADELYANYFSRYPNTFAGWYINWEMDNYAGYNWYPDEKQNMITALNTVSQHLDTLNPALPSSIAPFFNTNGGATPEQWELFWYDIMSQTSVDILMLQDGIGVGHATIDQLPTWYQHVCAGVWAAGKLCWSDLENFIGTNHLKPAPTQRIIDQHQAEYPYVDKIITYSFIEAMSPEWGWDPVYYNGYKNYVDSVRSGTPTPTPTPEGPTPTPTEGPSPTPTDTPTPTPTNTPTPTPTNTPQAGQGMHVSTIDMWIVLGGANHEAHANVTIVDDYGQPVVGARVYGHWDVNNLDQYADTNTSGVAHFFNYKMRDVLTYTFCVTNVVEDGLTYDPGANVETCDSITG
jgi:hypothetical protein